MERLEPFIGEWSVEAVFPGMGSSGLAGSSVFAWELGGQFLSQRSRVDHPEAPDALSIIGPDTRGDAPYLQHYFDSRGVVRLYAMDFTDGVWTLRREQPDFTPLSFSQRYTGTFDEDGSAIRGRWEISRDGGDWELDFELNYFKVG